MNLFILVLEKKCNHNSGKKRKILQKTKIIKSTIKLLKIKIIIVLIVKIVLWESKKQKKIFSIDFLMILKFKKVVSILKQVNIKLKLDKYFTKFYKRIKIINNKCGNWHHNL